MGFCKPLLGVLVLLVAVLLGYLYHFSTNYPEIPEIRLGHWAPGAAKPDDTRIRPFKIQFPASDLKNLQDKLALSRTMVPPLEGVAFQYGFNTQYLKTILEHWQTKYNWTERQTFLNQFPQYKTQIGGLDIHFIHVKPDPKKAQGKEVVPLLLVHGWPGSVREFYSVIPLLTTPRQDRDFVFEVIAPSLPGFGFSQASAKVGMGPPQMATIFAELMTRLGYEKFYFQGGDWGSIVGHSMAVLYPKRVLGYHCNFCLATTPGARLRSIAAYFFPTLLVEEDKRDFYKAQFFDSMVLESGYYHIQATKPDTVGVALTDSPIGLAAYILEKFSTATNKDFRQRPDGGLEKYNKDDLLDNLMIYWLTSSMTTAMRIYSENYVKETYTTEITSNPVMVPTHCAIFPHELFYYPKIVLQEQYKNLVSTTLHKRGGHFAAFEEPKLFADDVWDFLERLRSIKNVNANS